ncbi:probable protein phosphatase 2C 6 isoform X2 [Malania oleifera]|uniref:probable protein phosphatase 2C 6 isoform X2 n=1 Tax=Malania oleifera TaxID=397392 RepID=UPI0025AEAEA0|nr:probable protein phosphatase 2C 6 isoform X2 [Malania oleifera]
MKATEDEDLRRVELLSELDLESTSSGLSSMLGTSEDAPSTTSLSDISATSSSSGEIPAAAVAEAVVPRPLDPAPSGDAVGSVGAVARHKCVGKSNRNVTWGFTSVIGRRREMEDAVAVVPGFMLRSCDRVGGCTAPLSRASAEISPVHFFGVYDGHGGSQEEWDRETIDGYEWRKRWELAFSTSFDRVDNEVSMQSVAPEMVGSTAAVVVLSGCQIITSNCGDSRAILCRGTQTIPLTIDQKPDREDELMRIEGEGGKVINWNGARVFGVLAMSRAIGDRYLRPWIIPVPEITFTTRSGEDECLILASDGLWDVMTNDEVGEFACRMLRRRRRSSMVDEISPAQAVADNLTEIAFARNSSDNISIIVVDLKSRKRHQHRQ